jgi:hypothetical protein
MEEKESSDGSYNANDFLEEDEFNDANCEGAVWELSAEKYGEEVVADIKSILHHMYTYINFSDSLSLHYIQLLLK